MNSRLEGEHILIIGFGYRTGLCSANFLMKRGIAVSISDSKSADELSELKAKLISAPRAFFTGKQDIFQLDGIDKIVLSPGVPRTISLVKEALKRNIPVLSEIELAYSFAPEGVKIIGITGTDGKSTTVTLLHELLKTTYTSYLGGNIGTPFILFAGELKKGDVVVLELSSYQLEDNTNFICDVSSILNISEDHLDRYPSFDDYIKAKENIFDHTKKDGFAVLNKDNSYYGRFKKRAGVPVGTFSKSDKSADAHICCNDIIVDKQVICNVNKTGIKGVHNLENILCASLIAKRLCVSSENIGKVLKNFKGLPHRNEFVKSLNGIDFINDSKATTINSVIKAIESQNKPIVLMLGGRDKGLDFSILKEHLKLKVKYSILFGEARGKIASQLSGIENLQLEKDFERAVKLAYQKAQNGDVVLLSPGCTSWDAFSSFEERGNVFRKIVEGLV
jgi:UDP-N-acetylmuramoylalanine--D-glutamate ligase